MNIKKIIAFVLAVGLVSAFTGCNKSSDSSSSETNDSSSSSVANETTSSDDSKSEDEELIDAKVVYQDFDDGIVMNIGGFDVTEDEYKYYFAYAKSSMDNGDESYWNDDSNFAKINSLKEQTLNYLVSSYTVYKLAAENNVELDESDWDKVNAEYEDSKVYYELIHEDEGKVFDDYLKEIYCTEEVYKESFARTILEYKVVAALYQQDFLDTHFKDYICAKTLLVKDTIEYETDADNNPTDTPKNFYEINSEYSYTDEEKAIIEKLNSYAQAKDEESLKNTLPEFMELLQSRLDAGESIDSLMQKYNMSSEASVDGNGNYKGDYIAPYSMADEFCDVAFALEENEISEPTYVTDYGYYIIERIPFNDEELITIYMSDTEYSYAEEYYELAMKTQSDMEVIYDTDYDKISVDFVDSSNETEETKNTEETTTVAEDNPAEETAETQATEETTTQGEVE